jgi:hypothetical protein
MSNRNRRGGFAKTHQTCPCPLHEIKCFSIFADDPSSGYCFACSQVVRGKSDTVRIVHLDHISTRATRQEFVPGDVLLESTWPIVNFVSTFCNAEGFQEAFTDYVSMKLAGIDHLTAYRRSGFKAFTRSRLPEISGAIRGLPRFFQKIIYLTGMPNVLTAYNIGQSNNGAIDFWIIDTNGRVCNAQCIHYNGLNRDTNATTRYKYQKAEGYMVSAFFGAEQLQRDALSWLKQKFSPHAPICIVESPKSAILAAVLYPEIIWLASCGSSGVTPAKAFALRGREVHILFDNDAAGRNGAQAAMKVLSDAGALPTIMDPEVAYGGPRPVGWDIGDEVLRILGGQS